MYKPIMALVAGALVVSGLYFFGGDISRELDKRDAEFQNTLGEIMPRNLEKKLCNYITKSTICNR